MEIYTRYSNYYKNIYIIYESFGMIALLAYYENNNEFIFISAYNVILIYI